MTKEHLHFKTNVLLKSIIGKDLITDDHIAVLELVKNSFDALSPKVEIIFKNVKKLDSSNSRLPKIIIQDYGKGMNKNDIENKWLNIAYSEKKEIAEFQGRTMAGNKGVGRFSCDRLGKNLDIYTKVDGGEFLHLNIDWRKFEIDNQQELKIQDVDLTFDQIPDDEFENVTGYDTFKHGTILEISNLRSTWDRDKILALRKNLEKLINPNQAFEKDDFEIEIIASEFEEEENKKDFPENNKVNGTIENKVFQQLNFKATSIESRLDKDGEVITTTLQDRGREIFRLKERNTLFNRLKNISTTIYYLNTYSKAYFTRQSGVRSVDFGSIFLFINGFRVPPYGDYGDDWLGIEVRKGQGYNRFLGTREILGRIEISDKEGVFQIISNRAGVVNSPAFKQIVNMESPHGFFYRAFRRLERFVVEGIKWDSVTKDVERKIDAFLKEKTKKSINEEYKDSDSTRNKRILGSIVKIINAKSEDIIELTINEQFILEILERQRENVKEQLEQVFKKIKEESLDATSVAEMLKDLEEEDKEVQDITSVLKKYTEEFNLSSVSDELSEIEALTKNLEEEKERMQKLHDELQKAEKEKEELEKKLELEKEKNTYLKASSRGLSEDAKGLVHNIKLTAKAIASNATTLYERARKGDIKQKDFLRKLSVIKFNAEKALKISRLITRANFKTQANSQIIDITKFVQQYIELYSDIYETNQLQFHIDVGSSSLVRKINVLDLSLILDDLISNSEKAGANQILVQIKNLNENKLKILFSDDGKGVDKRFMEAPEEMFELGATSTDGSGIGLNSVRKTLKTMNAEISFKGNDTELKGACFEIVVH